MICVVCNRLGSLQSLFAFDGKFYHRWCIRCTLCKETRHAETGRLPTELGYHKECHDAAVQTKSPGRTREWR